MDSKHSSVMGLEFLLVKPAGSRFKHAGKKFPYDHRHRHALDEGVLYEFDTAYQLVSDFYDEVDRVLKEVCP